MDIDKEKRKDYNPPSCSHSRTGSGCHNDLLFMRTTLLSTASVVFPLFKKVFWNRCALIARTVPFNTSFINSEKVSMIITSFPKKGKGLYVTTTHPYNF